MTAMFCFQFTLFPETLLKLHASAPKQVLSHLFTDLTVIRHLVAANRNQFYVYIREDLDNPGISGSLIETFSGRKRYLLTLIVCTTGTRLRRWIVCWADLTKPKLLNETPVVLMSRHQDIFPPQSNKFCQRLSKRVCCFNKTLSEHARFDLNLLRKQHYMQLWFDNTPSSWITWRALSYCPAQKEVLSSVRAYIITNDYVAALELPEAMSWICNTLSGPSDEEQSVRMMFINSNTTTVRPIDQHY